MNDLLSRQIFVPLAKISFSAFLIHNNVLEYYVSQLRIPLYYTPIQLVVVYLGLIVLTLIISAFLTITIEMPFKNLEKYILPITSQSSRMCQSESTSPIAGLLDIFFLKYKLCKRKTNLLHYLRHFLYY